MKTKEVIVLPYDPNWAIEFEKLSAFLKDACGDFVLEICHVGSTSVPGLSAKPILDVDLVIESLKQFNSIKHKLALVGYRHEGDLGIPGREAFKYDSTPFMAHHLYVLTQDAPELKRHLAFRDHLRTHPNDRDDYGEVKRKAALAHPRDIDAYMEDKNDLIQAIYRKIETDESHVD